MLKSTNTSNSPRLSQMPRVLEDRTLPVPWVAVFDDASGKTYYWNKDSGATT